MKIPLTLFAAAVLSIPAAASAQETESQELSVHELELAHGIEDGQAVDPATTFSSSDGRIYAIVRLRNPQREATSVRVSFEPVDHPRQGLELSVPAQRRYRTVARTFARRPAGTYRCVVRDAEGNELASMEFEITE